MNAIETLVVKGPAWRAFQRFYAGRNLLRMGGRTDGARVLDVGCGSAVGTRIILAQFGAARIIGFDLDSNLLRIAARKLATSTAAIELYVADATQMPFADHSFDAVFDFAVLHHVPCWRQAIGEIARVLRPGGRFYFEEFTARALNHWLVRALTVHPEQDRFSAGQFLGALAAYKLRVEAQRVDWWRTTLLGVARLQD